MKKKNKFNFRDDIDIEYERMRADNHGDICGDGICRCTTLENVEIIEIKIPDVAFSFFANIRKKSSEIDIYCLNRFLTINKYYEVDNWQFDIEKGYYGEELERVYPIDINSILNFIDEITKLNFNKKIEKILELEYGYVLDAIRNKNWSIVSINPISISMNQLEYKKKIYEEDFYKDFRLPVAICIKENDEYRLIDGYHRLFNNLNKKQVSIILGEQ